MPLPRPIKIAIGFLAADALWVILLLAKFGLDALRDLDQHPWLLAPLFGFSAWLLVAVLSIVGLLCRSRAALTSSIALAAGSTLLVGLPLALHILHRGLRGVNPPVAGVLSGACACLLTPLILLLAGRRAYLSPPGG